MKAKRQRRTLPYIFAELPVCEECGCVDFDCSGGTKWDSDAKCQYATCLNCGEPAKIISQIPPGAFRLTDKPEHGPGNIPA